MSDTGRPIKGELYDLLRAGLPDFVVNGKLQIRTDNGLAQHFRLSNQAIYLWFEKNRITPARLPILIELSAQTSEENRTVDFVPLTLENLWPFVAQ